MFDQTREFNGRNYSFILSLCEAADKYYFEIEARDKHSRLRSSVTNLNYILSQFEIVDEAQEDDEEKFMDSDWLLDANEMARVWVEGVFLFSDQEFIKNLERELDKDRSEGEWASYY